MKKNFILIALFFSLFLIVVGELFLYFNLKKNNNSLGTNRGEGESSNNTQLVKKEESSQNIQYSQGTQPPSSENQIGMDDVLRFEILGVQNDNTALSLRVISPENLKGEIFNSNIACENIVFSSYQLPEGKDFIQRTELFEKVLEFLKNSNGKDKLAFEGSCIDSSCSFITHNCVLILERR
ncbi:MAG: hypothetical protein KatS3mg088_729 [Patescibacteria group bacterium]|nr:MAG: hypothetical protein KatS3mg088_729 [Patescibacteria group bacterium]